MPTISAATAADASHIAFVDLEVERLGRITPPAAAHAVMCDVNVGDVDDVLDQIGLIVGQIHLECHTEDTGLFAIGGAGNQGLIRVFDVNLDGTVGPGRLFNKLVGAEAGVADGMKVDVEGNVYCTGPGGVHIIAPDGRLLGRLRIPGHCTNMAWGDDDMKSLYVTTFQQLLRTRLKIPGVAPG